MSDDEIDGGEVKPVTGASALRGFRAKKRPVKAGADLGETVKRVGKAVWDAVPELPRGDALVYDPRTYQPPKATR